MEPKLVLPPPSVEQIAAAKGLDLNHELTKGYAGRFIRKKARQLVGKARFTASDRPEIEQEMSILLLRRLPQFDPQKGHWNVFVTTVVTRYVATLLESRRAQKCEHSNGLTSLNVQVVGEEGERVELGRCVVTEQKENLTGRVVRRDEDFMELSHDMAVVLARLPGGPRRNESLAQPLPSAAP